MPQVISCPKCPMRMQVPDDATGKQVKCPRCGKQTTVSTPMDFIFMKWASCKHCGREFLIQNDQP